MPRMSQIGGRRVFPQDECFQGIKGAVVLSANNRHPLHSDTEAEAVPHKHGKRNAFWGSGRGREIFKHLNAYSNYKRVGSHGRHPSWRQGVRA